MKKATFLSLFSFWIKAAMFGKSVYQPEPIKMLRSGIHFLPIVWLLVLILPLANAQPKQERAILDVLKAKTEAYYASDAATYQSFWLQDSIASRSTIWRTGYELQNGWDSIARKLAVDITLPKIKLRSVSYQNAHLRITEKMAFVEVDEVLNWSGVDGNGQYTSHTYVVLVNRQNSWKITNQIRVSAESFRQSPATDEDDLNTIGYGLLQAAKVADALDVFKLNVKLHPASWNPYDSLGEAYALAGETKLAIENYEKSFALNPENKNAKEVLEKLKK